MKREDAVQVKAPRFDWSFNFGHVLTSVSCIASVLAFVWWTSAKVVTMELRIGHVETAAKNAAAAAELRAQTYIPIITGLVKSNDVQDERIGNMADAIRGIRADIAESNRQLRGEVQKVGDNVSTLREGVAELKAQRARN